MWFNALHFSLRFFKNWSGINVSHAFCNLFDTFMQIQTATCISIESSIIWIWVSNCHVIDCALQFLIKGARRWSQIVWESCHDAARLPIQGPTDSDTLGWCRIYTITWFYYNPSMVLAWKCWILMDIDIFRDGHPQKMRCCPEEAFCRHMAHSMAIPCKIF